MNGTPIEWNGHVVGHIHESETETFELMRTCKTRGRWVPLAN